MRRRVIGRSSAAILVVAGAGYALARFLRPDAAFDPASPEGIAQRSISCGDLSLSRAFAVREKRETPHGLLLLFTAKCLSPGGQDDVYGYYMFEDVIVGGRRSGRGGWARAAARPRSPFVDFSIGRSWSDHKSEVTVWGRVLDSRAVALEATFAAGEVIREQVPTGLFALTAKGTDTACELRVLDRHDHVLARVPLMEAARQCDP